MEVDKKKFKAMFPNLADEMRKKEEGIVINSVRSDPKTGERAAKSDRDLSNYDPDVIDFIRRCDTRQQAEEIIDYLQKRGEITPNYALKLRQQLKKRAHSELALRAHPANQRTIRTNKHFIRTNRRQTLISNNKANKQQSNTQQQEKTEITHE